MLIHNHFNKVDQLLDLLLIWRIFSLCPITQFTKARLIVDGCCVGCSNYRAIRCADIVNSALVLFRFFPFFLDLGHIERFYLLLFLLEVRCLCFCDIKPFLCRIDNNIIYFDIGPRAKPNIPAIRCFFPIWQTRNSRNDLTVSLNLHIQTLHL
ncbi:hypothetical protein DW882_10270 [Faecalibacterium prausnitzii]|nr:hypothetical protein DW882_10270 [Faecalibacterium prausnitzii]